MKTIFSTAIVLLASLCFTVGLARSQEAEKTTTFTEINGNVVDSRGKPIEKFTVDIKVFDYSKGGWSVAPEVIGKWNGEFENGEFQFDVADPIKVDDKVYIYRTIKAAGHLELGQNAGYKLLSTFKGDFGKIKLSRAIKITGKIVLPVNQQEEELLEPKIYLAENLSRIAPDYNKTFQRSAKVEKDGSFEVLVPEDRKLNITASCNNAATTEQRFTPRRNQTQRRRLGYWHRCESGRRACQRTDCQGSAKRWE